MRPKCRILLDALIVLSLAGKIAAGSLTAEQVQMLLAEDGVADNDFGWSVSVDGDTAVIGAHSDDDNGSFSGSAYVFTSTNGVWTRQAKLLADDGSERLGWSVSVDGDTAVIGAFHDVANGRRTGSAYVFVRTNGEWTQQAKLLADDGAAGDEFGWSVSVDGDTAVIGARYDRANFRRSGSAYVFVRTAGEWTQQAKLLAADWDDRDQFGNSVSVDGDTAVIGAWSERLINCCGSRGAAYVFVRTGGEWTQQAKLLADDGESGDHFGSSISVDGDTAVIGASTDDHDNVWNAGSAYVFVRTNGEWTQQAKLLADDGSMWEQFGISVSMDGDTAVIGANWDDDNGTFSGSAYVFSSTNGEWTQQAKLLADDGVAGDEFGWSVSVDGDTAVIGVYGDEGIGADPGRVYVFRLISDPVDLVDVLMEQVRSLRLHHGTENSLTSKLKNAFLLLTDVIESNDHAAANMLGAFAHQVNAQRGKKIAEADADELTSAAQEIVELITDD